MYRNYCDRCDKELSNTYWRTKWGKVTHTVKIKIDESTVMDMLLCDECYKNIEKDIFKAFDWFQKKEKEEATKLGIEK